MQELFENNKLLFIDDSGETIMSLCYMDDEFVWYFRNSNIIKVTSDMNIYSGLEYIMNQDYEFSSEGLRNLKTRDKLIWYCDCYYNPNDELSIKRVSYLTIERKENAFYLKCIKPIYEELNITNRYHVIAFSPAGNGSYSKNINTGSTLQDDIAIKLYHNIKKEFSKKKVLI